MHHYRLHRDPRSSHQQIIGHVLRLRKDPVLDVGAAQGILGRLAEGSGLVMDAIEPHPEWAEHARPHYRQVFNSTVEAAPLADKSYRMVICGDVLEHTADPVSVPNVAHLAVRMMLLFGSFPKMERGILDKTHLQFFTRDTAEAMLRQAGLKVVSASATGIPMDEVWRRGEKRAAFRAAVRMQHVALDLAPRLFGMQWVFVAEPADGAK